MSEKIQESLFPNTIYRFDSGGNPRNIPDLSYEQFMAFHAYHYHPSNSLTVMYGDDPEEARLEKLDAYFRDFDPLEKDITVPLQPVFDSPRRFTDRYAAGAQSEEEDAGKTFVSMNWLLGEKLEVAERYGLSILEQILLGTPASPLHKALIDSGLGEDLTSSGIDTGIRQLTFSVGLKGVQPDQTDDVELLILNTLRSLSDNGIDPGDIEAAINSTEFALRERNTGSFPRGLAYMFGVLSTWIYGGDPIAPLAFETPLAAIRERAAKGNYFEEIIRSQLLNNTHRTTVLLIPDATLDQEQTADEIERLKRIHSSMTEEQRRKVVEETRLLQEMQATPDSPEALALLPTLKLSDIEPGIKIVPVELTKMGEVQALYHDLATNGVVYFDLGMNLHALPQELLPYLNLFGRALLETGTEKDDFIRLTQRIGQKTGGIYNTNLLSSKEGSAETAAWLMFRSKAIPSHSAEMLSLLKEILLTARLGDRDRFKQMAQEEKARIETHLPYAGSGFITRRLRSHFSEADWVSEQISGLEQLFFLRRLLPQIDSDWETIHNKLEQMRSLLVNRRNMIVNVTTDSTLWPRFSGEIISFLEELPTSPTVSHTWDSTVSNTENEAFTIPGQVNHVAMAFNIFASGYSQHGSYLPIQNYLNTTWLWEQVRQMGGAYGAGCGLDRLTGVFLFTSYRDPNILETLQRFEKTGSFLMNLDISESECERTVIGAIGTLDSYQLPDAKGYSSMVRYLTGISDEVRQLLRDQVLAANKEHFQQFAESLSLGAKNAIFGVVGAPNNIEAANKEKTGLFKLIPTL